MLTYFTFDFDLSSERCLRNIGLHTINFTSLSQSCDSEFNTNGKIHMFYLALRLFETLL